LSNTPFYWSPWTYAAH